MALVSQSLILSPKFLMKLCMDAAGWRCWGIIDHSYRCAMRGIEFCEWSSIAPSGATVSRSGDLYLPFKPD